MAKMMTMTFDCPKCNHSNTLVEFGVDPFTGDFGFFVTCSGELKRERCEHAFQVKATHAQLMDEAQKTIGPEKIVQIPEATLERYPIQ